MWPRPPSVSSSAAATLTTCRCGPVACADARALGILMAVGLQPVAEMRVAPAVALPPAASLGFPFVLHNPLLVAESTSRTTCHRAC